jgi:hypothetical protein
MGETMTEQARDAVRAGRSAHLVTLNPDGSPQVLLVVEGGAAPLFQQLAGVYRAPG